MNSSPPNPSEVTDLLAGRYALLEVLGEGGMARVYRAFDRHLRVPRAIKVVHPTMLGRQARLRLAQEAQLMARLAHPNVVTLFELGEDGERLFLVMELVEGGSVADRIARAGPLPPRMAAQVTLGLLSALELAHAQGIVHRDVKPHNILLDRAGAPRVTDFGIARSEEGALTRTGAILGTLAYMPPEQKASARKVDARSDLYAAGATFYAMLTGREPHDLFAAGFDPTVASELLGQLPPAVAAWILRATSFRPDDRYASAASMAAALAVAVQDLPEDPPGPPLVTPPSPGPDEPASLPTFAIEPTDAQEPPPQRPALSSATGAREPRSRLGYALITLSLLGLVALLAVGVLTASSGALLLAVLPGTGEEVARQHPKETHRPTQPPKPTRPPEPTQLWEVTRDKQALVATLQAEHDVTDNTGARGRPRLVLRCERGKLYGQLQTGLEDVDIATVDTELAFAAVEIQAGERSEGRLFPKSRSDPGILDLTGDRTSVERLLSEPEVTFTYTSSSMAIVTAAFRPRDEALLRTLRRCR